MKEVLEAGGEAFLVPAVLFLLVLYGTRGLFGLHGRRSQHRRDFLELWDKARSADDLWLEVSVKHLFGTYLPADVIRLALGQPDRGRSLADLSELWDLLAFNPEDRTVHWKSTLQSKIARSKWGRILSLAAYFACALAATTAGWLSAQYGHTSFAGWVYGGCAVVLGFAAFISLSYEDTTKIATQAGSRWVGLINRSATKLQGDDSILHTDRYS